MHPSIYPTFNPIISNFSVDLFPSLLPTHTPNISPYCLIDPTWPYLIDLLCFLFTSPDQIISKCPLLLTSFQIIDLLNWRKWMLSNWKTVFECPVSLLVPRKRKSSSAPMGTRSANIAMPRSWPTSSFVPSASASMPTHHSVTGTWRWSLRK